MRPPEDKRTGTPRQGPSPTHVTRCWAPTSLCPHHPPRPPAALPWPRREEPEAGCASKTPSASGHSAASVRGRRAGGQLGWGSRREEAPLRPTRRRRTLHPHSWSQRLSTTGAKSSRGPGHLISSTLQGPHPPHPAWSPQTSPNREACASVPPRQAGAHTCEVDMREVSCRPVRSDEEMLTGAPRCSRILTFRSLSMPDTGRGEVLAEGERWGSEAS